MLVHSLPEIEQNNTLTLHRQGGTMMVPGTRVEETKDAIASFIEREKRQEAAIVAAFRHRLENGEQTVSPAQSNLSSDWP